MCGTHHTLLGFPFSFWSNSIAFRFRCRLALAPFTCLPSSLPIYFVSFIVIVLSVLSLPHFVTMLLVLPIFIHQWLSQHSIVYILCMYISIWLYAWICVTYYILDRVGFVGIIIMSISMFSIIWFKYIALQNSLCSLITYEFIIKLYNAFLVAVVITWTD